MTTPDLITDLKRDEGLRLHAYRDSRGRWTIGYGHTPAEPGWVWTQPQAFDQLLADAKAAIEALDRELAWWRTLDDVRQDAVANMAFNLGVGELPCPAHPKGTGLREFTHFLEALEDHDWHLASAAMLLSDWAAEVGDRAERLAAMIRLGLRPGHPLAAAVSAIQPAPPAKVPAMTETSAQTPAPAPISATPGRVQTATLDLARSVLMAAGTPLLAHGVATASQWQSIVGGLLAVASAVWSYMAAHPSQTGALASLFGLVRKGGQAQAWNGDVAALEAALLPIVQRQVDAQIKAHAGILATPVEMAANAALKDAGQQAEAHLRV